uniref:TFIIB-type domain-containing protein n=1 Tax=Sexangularia sp. CB-2014 TaxID=1486929 RepID=A0A6U0IZV3_9EUKA|mmetsp:Transcript_4207/g.13692  ORF Transcript_4207/g.13692 Transcript_4207/m.13692 type:complete len:449 (+) Transcript_4207:505-1851(+)
MPAVKYTCPTCHANASFSARTQSLSCAYCGTVINELSFERPALLVSDGAALATERQRNVPLVDMYEGDAEATVDADVEAGDVDFVFRNQIVEHRLGKRIAQRARRKRAKGSELTGRGGSATRGDRPSFDLPDTVAADYAAAGDAKPGEKLLQRTCTGCQAVVLFSAAEETKPCDFCGIDLSSTPLIDAEDVIPVDGVLEFKLTVEDARAAVHEWIKGLWCVPSTIRRTAFVDSLHGVYLPFFTFDASCAASWKAESGTYYYTNESYTDRDGHRRTRRVRHVRWRWTSGNLAHFFDDIVRYASKGVPWDRLDKIKPFPLAEMKAYHRGFLAGFTVERYQIELEDAASSARRHMERAIYSMCAQAVPGDTYRSLSVNSNYSGETFKHVLVPVYIVTYFHRDKPYQVLVNGHNGMVSGDSPTDWFTICATFACLALIALIVCIVIAIVGAV